MSEELYKRLCLFAGRELNWSEAMHLWSEIKEMENKKGNKMPRLPKKKQIIWNGTIGFGGKRKNKGKVIRRASLKSGGIGEMKNVTG